MRGKDQTKVKRIVNSGKWYDMVVIGSHCSDIVEIFMSSWVPYDMSVVWKRHFPIYYLQHPKHRVYSRKGEGETEGRWRRSKTRRSSRKRRRRRRRHKIFVKKFLFFFQNQNPDMFLLLFLLFSTYQTTVETMSYSKYVGFVLTL